ncbi:MAG: four helix bundle suffix domain-containing protein [Prevotella sp.]
MSNDFLDQRGDYHSLIAFKKAECIYDITYHFAHRFLKIGDRTIDQMVQAARSGKQNLAEGYIDGVTSMEMMIKLINVNRGSLHELCLDYEDYLRVRNLQQWSYEDPRCRQTRAFCRTHLDSAVYREQIPSRSDETIANIAITLIHQEDVLLKGYIEWLKRKFLANGGFKEQMYRARTQYRGYGGYGVNGSHGANGAYGVNGAKKSPSAPQPPSPPPSSQSSQPPKSPPPTPPPSPGPPTK